MTATLDPTLRRARTAVAVLFLTNGAIFANILPRYPGIKADLDLSNASYGLAVAALPAGALVAGLAAGVLIQRLRSSRVAVVGTFLAGLASFAIGLSPSAGAFATGLFLLGAVDAVTDVAQNAHGLRVQRRYGRSILNSFHAVWSAGAVLGGLMGAGAVALGLSPAVHLGLSSALFTLVAIAAYPFLLRGPEADPVEQIDAAPGARPRRVSRSGGPTPRTVLVLGALVVLGIAGTLVEDAGSTWAAVYLSDSLGAAGSIAAFGYVALVGAQFVGRLVGDRLVDRYGERAVVRVGGLVTAAGMGAALAFPSVPATIAGFAAAGFGVATVIPAAMHGADELPGFKPGTGLTLLTWLMRIGFLVSPPLVGLIADATSLRVGLLVVPLAGITLLALAGVLDGRRRPQSGS
ncbi:MFS transporter [Mumia sp. zg.B21]|uniref:MFS transporter n=1 Tax=Mumia sp. zg.B21 TaxID=2855447 RepID=UPI001C6E26AC|nr:MFS transporter [Mumia sp. zg.B21]MBW9210537.1 MFS transporter [Mumia sp. zg.B21]